ncbi:MAG: Crp/Fnr family transcriptional regulator [Gemmatimonadales bacterium]|jgi:CRP-like cAMP-binding protein
MDYRDALREVPLFAQLRDGDLERLGTAAHGRSYRKNAVILLQGKPVEGLHVILSGTVKLALADEEGREVIISTRGQGDYFGETALLNDVPLTTDAIAMEDSEILVLRRETFHACVEEIPHMTFGLLRGLCRRLRKADRRISSLAMLDVRQRIAHLLLELADENDGQTITHPLTQHVIAQMIGSSRETVARVMPDLASAGLIETNRRPVPPVRRPGGGDVRARTRRVITILDRAGLEAVARESG